MRFRDIFLTANGNLRKSKLRTFLTSSAVFIGALTLMLTTGVGYGLRTYVEEQVNAAGAKDALIITAKQDSSGPISNDKPQEYNPDQQASEFGFAQMTPLTQQDIDAIRSTEHITYVEPLYSTPIEYVGHGDRRYKATIVQGLDGLNIPLSAGRHVDADGDKYEITLAPTLVEPLGFASPDDAVGTTVDVAFKDSEGTLFTLPAEIVGVQEKTFIQANAMNMSVKLAKDAFERATEGQPEFQKNQFMTAVAKFDYSIPDETLQQVKKELEDKGMSASTLDDQLGVINAIINGITTFLNIFAAIALAAASFGIVNTLLMAVQERTREIGLMKALGMSRRRIFLLFSLEAMLIGLWSSLLALGAANIIGRIGSNIASETILKDFEGLELFSFPALPMLGVVALIMAIAFLAATLPARRASRLNPIEALRYE